MFCFLSVLFLIRIYIYYANIFHGLKFILITHSRNLLRSKPFLLIIIDGKFPLALFSNLLPNLLKVHFRKHDYNNQKYQTQNNNGKFKIHKNSVRFSFRLRIIYNLFNSMELTTSININRTIYSSPKHGRKYKLSEVHL